jgi:ATP-binding cassette subfamily F protein uup
VAEYIDTGVGRDRYLSASDMLKRFHFPHKKQGALVGTLSGGERRRLALLMVLMKNPNVLFLDEPTNDFDIQTLNALEEYLQNFQGFLVVVSHDRMFLDRTVEYIYSFDGGGKIKQYPGNYTAYLERKETEGKNSGNDGNEGKKGKSAGETEERKVRNPRKLTYKEEREFAKLEKDIAAIEEEKAALNTQMNDADADYAALAEMGQRLHDLDARIEELSDRWLELAAKLESEE